MIERRFFYYNCENPSAYDIWFFARLYLKKLSRCGFISIEKYLENDSLKYYEGRNLEEEYPEQYNFVTTQLPYCNYDNMVDVKDLTRIHIIKYNYKQIMDCIINKRAFVILETKPCLQKLHNLGIKTFHPFINEDYDDASIWNKIPLISDYIRIMVLEKTVEEREEIYKKIKDITNHNYELWKKNEILF